MLSTIGFIAVLLIVFTVGFALGRKPSEPIKINVKFEEFAVEDLELCRNIMKSVADCIDATLVDVDEEDTEPEATPEESVLIEEDEQKE